MLVDPAAEQEDSAMTESRSDLAPSLWRYFCARNTRAIWLGQLVSLAIFGTNVSSNKLVGELNLKIPTLQSFTNYLLLFLVFGTATCWNSRRRIVNGNDDVGLLEDHFDRQIIAPPFNNEDADKTIIILNDDNSVANINDQRQIILNTPRRALLCLKSNYCFFLVLFALCDVYGNFLIVLAFQFTSSLSVAVLDTFNLPVSIFLQKYFLKANYKIAHYLAILVCILGLVLTMYADYTHEDNYYTAGSASAIRTTDANDNTITRKNENVITSSLVAFLSVVSHYTDRVITGDILALAGAALYAVSNVLEEAIVKTRNYNSKSDIMRMLFHLGAFASVLSFVQACIDGELKILLDFFKESDYDQKMIAVEALVGFQLSMFLLYTSTSLFFTDADAVAFQLSILTSDIYVALYQAVALQQPPSVPYCLAFCITLSGVVLYRLAGDSPTNFLSEEQRRMTMEHDESLSIPSRPTRSRRGTEDPVLQARDNRRASSRTQPLLASNDT